MFIQVRYIYLPHFSRKRFPISLFLILFNLPKGGAHEVMSTDYQLQWKNRLGFVKQALKHKAPIVPVATVGTNDMLNVVTEIPIGWLTGHHDLNLPILKPNMTVQRIYYRFGKPIYPETFFPSGNIDHTNEEALMSIRDAVKAELEEMIDELRKYQANDPQRYLSDRISSTKSSSSSE